MSPVLAAWGMAGCEETSSCGMDGWSCPSAVLCSSAIPSLALGISY